MILTYSAASDPRIRVRGGHYQLRTAASDARDSKNNLYTLYDMAMLGIIKHSKVPLRLMSIVGFLLSAACFLVACILIILKLMFWNYFTVGIIPIMISIFFFAAVQMVAIGFLGEYIR